MKKGAVLYAFILVFFVSMAYGDTICIEAGDKEFIYSQICMDFSGGSYDIYSVFGGVKQNENGDILSTGTIPFIRLDNGDIFILIEGIPMKVLNGKWKIVLPQKER